MVCFFSTYSWWVSILYSLNTELLKCPLGQFFYFCFYISLLVFWLLTLRERERDMLKSTVVLVDLSVSYNFVSLALYILRCIQIFNCCIFLHILTFYPYEVITFIISGSPYVKICFSRMTSLYSCASFPSLFYLLDEPHK